MFYINDDLKCIESSDTNLFRFLALLLLSLNVYIDIFCNSNFYIAMNLYRFLAFVVLSLHKCIYIYIVYTG